MKAHLTLIIRNTSIALLSLMLSAQIWADEQSLTNTVIDPMYGLWSIAATAKSSQFKAVDNTFKATPLIFGGFGPIFIEANRFGYNFYRDGTYFSSLIGNIRNHSNLSNDDIKSSSFLRTYDLNERKGALESGIQIGRRFNNGWVSRIAVLQDISSTHKGHEIELTVYRRDNVKPLANFNSIRLLTTLGLQSQSQKLNDYYYGINSHELANNSQKSYQANSGLSLELELIATYDFSWQKSGEKHWGVYAGLRHYQYSDTVEKSPIIESGLVQQYFMGLGRYF